MAFNSLNFWLIFPFIFGVYWLIPARFTQWRKVFLLIVSYLLYMNWKPIFALVLLSVSLVTFCGGRLLDTRSGSIKNKRIVWLFALLGLFPLLFFKYYSFLNNCLTEGLASLGLRFSLPGLNWAVPIGISFFTFQAVGYMLDVYHGRIRAENNLIDYLLFVSFFPQVTSGPISMAEDLMPQVKAIHKFEFDQGKQGLKQLLWGMFIKLVIADRLGLFVDTVYSNFVYFSGATCFVAGIFYSFQIYCDFAGYSLMAIGIARTLGFNLKDNFCRPYLAVSITDFWRRWHISLTRWLTRQVYIPLGGNRCGKVKTYWNILVTFLISGIWHGANWTFIAWGALHGLLQVIEKAMGWQRPRTGNWLVCITRMAITFFLVTIAWILFRMPTISDAILMISKIFRDFGTLDLSGLDIITGLILIVSLFLLFFKEIKDEFFAKKISFLQNKGIRWCVYFVLFVMILSLGVLDSGQFIYVNF